MTAVNERVGEILLKQGLITMEQLTQARSDQLTQGGQIGKHLVLRGAISRRALYGALARQWGTPVVDLRNTPPSQAALQGIDWTKVTDRGWIPWRLDHKTDTLWIATCVPPTEELLDEARKVTGAQRLRPVTTTDWDIAHAVQEAFRENLRHQAAEGLADAEPEASARAGLRRWQRVLPWAVIALLILITVLSPTAAATVLFAAANLVFLINVGFKILSAAYAPIAAVKKKHWLANIRRERRARKLPQGPEELTDEDLPLYTILVPAYKESNVVEKVLDNLSRLNYPRSRLEVLLLLEEDDKETIEAAKAVHPPEYVRIVVVPEGSPQTKPRACNYGLTFSRGEFVVIFDAEDRPDPDELRRAVAMFRDAEFEQELHGGETLACIQGALNYFNADYNVLTRMFAIEYAHWFDMMLPGMDAFHLPIPLGGTSNHFRTNALREVGAWDPYNVTEDADLGLRLDTAGYRTGVIDATTWEEATSQVPAWIRQRTRWIKGYMMTAAVNLRRPLQWIRHAKFRGIVTMFGLILGTPLAFLAYPLAIGLTIATYIGFGVSVLGIPHWLVTAGWINMIGSNIAMIIVSGIAAARRYSWRIGVFAIFNPIYWFLHSIAAWRAAWQILRDPFKWEKTPHGLTGDYESGLSSAPQQTAATTTSSDEEPTFAQW